MQNATLTCTQSCVADMVGDKVAGRAFFSAECSAIHLLRRVDQGPNPKIQI